MTAGQTGTDRAAMNAALRAGLKTTGYMGQTEDQNDSIMTTYKLVTVDTTNPKDIAEMNMMISDALVIFGPRSRGSNMVEGIAQGMEKPILHIPDFTTTNECQKFRLWLMRNTIHTLCVVGNRESRTPKIGDNVEQFMARVFKKCRG